MADSIRHSESHCKTLEFCMIVFGGRDNNKESIQLISRRQAPGSELRHDRLHIIERPTDPPIYRPGPNRQHAWKEPEVKHER